MQIFINEIPLNYDFTGLNLQNRKYYEPWFDYVFNLDSINETVMEKYVEKTEVSISSDMIGMI